MYAKRIKLTQEMLGKIAKIDEFKGLWRGSLQVSPQILGRLKSSVIITSAGASTRIEGAKMSDEEVARLLRGLKSNLPKNRDEQEVAGYADLLGRIFDNYQTLKLTENNILHFHNILLKFSDKDQTHRGKYKSGDNAVIMKNKTGEEIVLFNPTKPYLVKPEMEAIINWTNEQLEKKEFHSLIVIANFIFEFLAIHPFLDGNGRLSRALTNLLLLCSGYAYTPYVSLDDIIEEKKDDYYLALRATQNNHKTDNEDLSPWLNFLLDAMLAQTEIARQLMNSEKPEKLLSERQEQVFAVLADGETLGVAEIDKRLNGTVPQVTIKQALARLTALRLIERTGQGRGVRYKKVEKFGMEKYSSEEVENIRMVLNNDFFKNSGFLCTKLTIDIDEDYFFKCSKSGNTGAYVVNCILEKDGKEIFSNILTQFTNKIESQQVAFSIAHEIWTKFDNSTTSQLWQNFPN